MSHTRATREAAMNGSEEEVQVLQQVQEVQEKEKDKEEEEEQEQEQEEQEEQEEKEKEEKEKEREEEEFCIACVRAVTAGLSTAAMEDLDKLKVSDLKAKLKERGLDTNGKKADLIARLKYDEEAELLGLDEAASSEAAGSGNEDDHDFEYSEHGQISEDDVDSDHEEVAPTHNPGNKTESTNQSDGGISTGGSSLEDKRNANAKSFGLPTTADTDNKRLQRAKRFGLETPDIKQAKHLERANRFGIITKEVAKVKRQQRAERFGIQKQASVDPEEQKKRLERAKRFGISVQITADSTKKPKKSPIATKNYSAMSVEDLRRIRNRHAKFHPDDTNTLAKMDAALATKIQ
eukprot:gene9498-1739_t